MHGRIEMNIPISKGPGKSTVFNTKIYHEDEKTIYSVKIEVPYGQLLTDEIKQKIVSELEESERHYLGGPPPKEDVINLERTTEIN